MEKTYKDVFDLFGLFLLFSGINYMIQGQFVGIIMMFFGLVAIPLSVLRQGVDNAEPFPSSKVVLEVSFAMFANGITFFDIANADMLTLGLTFTVSGAFLILVTLVIKWICIKACETPKIEEES